MQFHPKRRWPLKTLEITLIFIACCTPVSAQFPGQQLTAPPPMKALSRDERAQVEATKDSKGRIRTVIELAEAHLVKAEALTSEHNYDAALSEVGKYWGLVEDGLSFLSPMTNDTNKTRDLYKKLELALRAHGPRLVAMRRTTPLEYAVWIKEVEDFARNGRVEALNSFYGHTVVRESQQKPLSDKQSKDRPTRPEMKQP
jgi:hypothetical protein